MFLLGAISNNSISRLVDDIETNRKHYRLVKEERFFFKKQKYDFDLASSDIRFDMGVSEYFILFNGRLDDRGNLLQLLSIENEEISDVYLIALLFKKYDLKMLNLLEGDFAFSIWDKEKQRLLLARDPIGIKNLFYTIQNGTIIWSSTIRELLNFIPKKKINKKFIKGFLMDHPIATQDTAYEEVHRIENGQYLVYENGKIKKDNYFHFQISNISYKKEEDYFQHFHMLFEKSVRNRMRTNNNKISIPLSGGLDSSSIASVATNINKVNNHQHSISTYSIQFDEKEADERNFVQAVVEKYDLNSTLLQGDEEWNFKGDFDIYKDFDEPYPLFNRSLAAKTLKASKQDDISVVLTGHGGDHVLYADLNYLSSFFKRGKVISYCRELSRWKSVYPVRDLVIKNTIQPLFKKSNLRIPSWLNIEQFKDINLSMVLTNRFEELNWDNETITDYFNAIIRQTGHEWFDQYLSIPIGIERRYPFLDRRLMEYMAAIPPNIKITPLNDKTILREGLKDILPTDIYKRTSKGSHGFLISRGFKEEWKKIASYYDFNILTELNLINSSEIKEFCEKWYMGYRYDSFNVSGIMRALALEIWLSGKQDYI
jgi:asparagine synthase (glutamine-hydrolysing)